MKNLFLVDLQVEWTEMTLLLEDGSKEREVEPILTRGTVFIIF